MMASEWNGWLIFVSIAIAVLGAAVTVYQAQCVNWQQEYNSPFRTLVSSVSLSISIWSMHFIGMLAYHLPIAVYYHVDDVLYSFLLALLASFIAFSLLRRTHVSQLRLVVTAVLMGMVLSLMHYVGMNAMALVPAIDYDNKIVIFSVLIAIVVSWLALLILRIGHRIVQSTGWRIAVSAVLMGFGVAVFHYTAMLSVNVSAGSLCRTGELFIEPNDMAMLIAIMAGIWLLGSIALTLVRRHAFVGENFHADSVKAIKNALLINTSLSLLVAVFAAVAGYFWLNAHARAQLITEFEALANIQINAIESDLRKTAESLTGIRQYYAASDYVDPNEFFTYTEVMAEDTRVQAYEWIPRVTRSQRIAFEARAVKEGFRDYQIKDKHSGKLGPASQRDEYFPVNYIQPIAGNQLALGFDLGSEPMRRSTLERARDTGTLAFSDPIALVQGGIGALAFLPHYQNGRPPGTLEARRNTLLGFSLMVLRTEKLVHHALAQSPNSNQLAISLRASGLPGERGDYYRDSSHAASKQFFQNYNYLYYQRDIGFGGKQLEVTIHPTAEFIAAHVHSNGLSPWLLLPFLLVVLTYLLHWRALMNARQIALQLELHTQEKQAAEAETRIKSQFLANMSHEIRTPMNAIINLSVLALRTELTTKQRDYLNKIDASAYSLLRIINDILDFSKIEAGKMELETVPFRLDDTMTNLSSMLGVNLHSSKLEFLIHLAPDVPPVIKGDPVRLGQVLVNLVGNAIKFTSSGQVVLRVNMAEQSAHRARLNFSVVDTGIGMSPAQLDKLFSAFTQADLSTTRKYGGTGLGLMISKNIVELMGGKLVVTSQPGVGTEFQFSLWFDTVETQAERHPAHDILNQSRVLVVDDNPEVCMILAELLKNFGIRVTTVPSAQLALDELKAADDTDPYLLVLMDWRMPEMDGLEATHILLHQQLLEHRPTVVMITAANPEEVAAAAKEEGVSAILEKPITQSMLWDIFADTFADSSTRQALRMANHHDLTGIRVLVAEDNLLNQQIATELLESAGAHVTLANDGQEVLSLLESAPDLLPWSIILMDIQMPVMDGHQATQIIRSQSRFDQLPIVALTAHAMKEERERCLAEGMVDLLTKPLNFDLLCECVQRLAKARFDPTVKSSRDAAIAVSQADLSQNSPDISSLIIPGLDIKGSLFHLADNRKLYRSLLTQFVKNYADYPSKIQLAMAAGDNATAERLAHTLKGLSASIGAAELAALCSKLEVALKQGESWAALFEQLTVQLAQLLADVQSALITLMSPVKETAVALSYEQLLELGGKIDQLLAKSNVKGRKLFEDNAPALKAWLGNDYQQIENSMINFDFERALVHLRQGLKQAGLNYDI